MSKNAPKNPPNAAAQTPEVLLSAWCREALDSTVVPPPPPEPVAFYRRTAGKPFRRHPEAWTLALAAAVMMLLVPWSIIHSRSPKSPVWQTTAERAQPLASRTGTQILDSARLFLDAPQARPAAE